MAFTGRNKTQKNIVIRLRVDTRNFLIDAFTAGGGWVYDGTDMAETIKRLCGQRKPVDDSLSEPTGFDDATTASRNIGYVLGALADNVGLAQDEQGMEYRIKYPNRDYVLKRGVNEDFQRGLTTVDGMLNMIKDIEYEFYRAKKRSYYTTDVNHR